MVRVGIFGATGYTGNELTKILSAHPEVEIVTLASRSQAGVEVTLPVRTGRNSLSRRSYTLQSVDAALEESMDVAFMCLSHGEGAELAARSIDSQVRVVDLSADYRMKTAEQFLSAYGMTHPSPKHIKHFTYGMPELFREKIRGARAVANPGCYPTTVALAAAPFVQSSLLQQNVPLIVDAKSGVSGAGKKPSDSNHFIAVQENFRPYSVGRMHRHVPEMEQMLSDFSTCFSNRIVFTPGVLPVARGMLSSVYLPLSSTMTQDECVSLVKDFYAQEPFVTVLTDGRMTPDLASVRNSNEALLSVHVIEQTALVLVAIDNLGKGASGQAVQNFNLMMGFEETSGLKNTSSYY